MRGGEKCLEVLCERFPEADLFTLVHRRGSVAPVIEKRRVVESWIARLPFGRSRYRWFAPLGCLCETGMPITWRDFPREAGASKEILGRPPIFWPRVANQQQSPKSSYWNI